MTYNSTQSPPPSKAARWTGWILTILISGMLAMSAVMKFLQPPEVIKGFEHLGWPANLAFALGVLELACVIIYVLPPTAVLGAILVTGYLGGAIATHVRLGEVFHTQLILGIVAWGGIYLRDPRVRALIPFRSRRDVVTNSTQTPARETTATPVI